MPTSRKPAVEPEPPAVLHIGPLHPARLRGHGPQQPVKRPLFGADRLREVLGASTDVPIAELCETAATEVERLRHHLQRGDSGSGLV